MSDAASEESAVLTAEPQPTPTSPHHAQQQHDDEAHEADLPSSTDDSPSHDNNASPMVDSDAEESEYNPTAGQPHSRSHSLTAAFRSPCTAARLSRPGQKTHALLCCLCAADDDTAAAVVDTATSRASNPFTSTTPSLHRNAATTSTAASSAASSPAASSRSRSKPAPAAFQAQDFETRRSNRSHAVVSYKEKVTTPTNQSIH